MVALFKWLVLSVFSGATASTSLKVFFFISLKVRFVCGGIQGRAKCEPYPLCSPGRTAGRGRVSPLL